ncbi:hypothetical protein EXIGLDRAFT_362629 [Exidia glandulosa HHB12029]|uniref:C2H2-type domain-containing protein n=1 Tax=Exidia glandulosa HHB12029 TaxID=1314781 RepID=A0A165C5H9_EXIGL|nr:hypothetical protein EXIGLDRAFT_362629 [Exidia glandulosa HHB12029]
MHGPLSRRGRYHYHFRGHLPKDYLPFICSVCSRGFSTDMALGGHKKVHIVAATEKAPAPAPVSASASACLSSRYTPVEPQAQRRTPEQTSYMPTPSVSPQHAPTSKPPPRIVVPILRPLTELPPRRRSETDSETDSLPQTPASALFATAPNVPPPSPAARVAETETARTFGRDAYYMRQVDPALIIVSLALSSRCNGV